MPKRSISVAAGEIDDPPAHVGQWEWVDAFINDVEERCRATHV